MLRYATQEHFKNYLLEKEAAKKNDKYKDNSLAPEVMGAAALGLFGYQAIKKGPRKALENVTDGAKAGILKGVKGVKVGKTTKAVTELAKGGVNRARKTNEAWNRFERDLKLKSGRKIGDKLTGKEYKDAWKDFSSKVDGLDKQIDQEFNAWKSQNNVKKSMKKLNNAEREEFEKHLNNKIKNPVVPPNSRINKSPSGGENILKGVGFGASAAATSLGVHAAGQKYFDRMDDDKVRALVRESYDSQGASGKKEERDYPIARAEKLKKQASAKGKMMTLDFTGVKDLQKGTLRGAPDAEKVRLVDKAKKELSEFGELSAGTIIDSAIAFGMPIGASYLVGKDIRGGFKPLDPDKNLMPENSQSLVIDIPLSNTVQKQASESPVDPFPKALIDQKAKGTGIDIPQGKAYKFLMARKRQLYRSIPWAIGSGLALKAMGDAANLGALHADENQLPPIQDGYARMTIQTKPTGGDKARQISDAMMMKRAAQKEISYEDAIDAIVAEISKSIEAPSKDHSSRGAKRVMSQTPKEGLIGRSYQQKMNL